MAEKFFVQNDRKRKFNFSTLEINKITELVEENIEIIHSNLTNAITNKRNMVENCRASEHYRGSCSLRTRHK